PRQRVVSESDVDDHGARVALVRLPRVGAPEGKSVMDDLTRRDVIKLGAVATVAATLGVTESLAQTVSPASPAFLTPDQFAMLDELSEMIIPTDAHSPGAKAAKVAAYIDARLAEAFEESTKTIWRDGLTLVDRLAQEMNGKPFMQSSPDQRIAVLTR